MLIIQQKATISVHYFMGNINRNFQWLSLLITSFRSFYNVLIKRSKGWKKQKYNLIELCSLHYIYICIYYIIIIVL